MLRPIGRSPHGRPQGFPPGRFRHRTERQTASTASTSRRSPANGANPHKLTGGLALRLDRDDLYPRRYRGPHRPHAAGLRSSRPILPGEPSPLPNSSAGHGENQFHFSMRMKEPAVIDVDSDVVWERVDAHRWRCRSYSTHVAGGRQGSRIPAPARFVLAFRRNGKGRLRGSRNHHAERRIQLRHAHARIA